ncbi:ABC transporter substrate-binding protein [Desulforhabdus amnigena]|uniref:Branched-chain amino acid ABC transporter substrate-binding protein n=1 Tax=Desulforhabdus amnigena TaxID=40218 RepID=A0A9W6CWS9_9BACT|nr:ABC transporter substrate-binding protein [Desulforhabdus amnigena]NLJ29554.1 ABC transporter substrate-binding protein [Deltaproteobacteria bacterium]GLI34019.1 branched-chain amino acid ABC transporter substrate-binding protein [Desulforhabdus amnigena]
MERKGSVLKKTLAIGMLILLGLYPAVGWSKDVYKIGGIFSITGPSSFLGDPEKKSLEMVVDKINAEGGIDGHMLEAVIYDTEGDPGKAVLAVNKLISKDNVLAIIGPSLTPTTLAVVPIVEKSQVPLISCAAGIKITEPVKPWVFKTAQSDVLAVAAIYEHMKKHGIKKVGIITVENAFGESGKEQLLAQAPKFGLEIVQQESFGAKDTDMTPQLTKLRSAQPDAVICWGTNPGPAVVAKNARQMNLNMPLYQSHGVASPKFIELAGDAADGILLPTGKILVAQQLPETDPQKAVLLDYINTFEKRFEMPVSGFGGYAYDAMHLLADALKGTEGDKQKIRDALEKITGKIGVTGVFNFTAQDHNGLGSDAFVMVKIEKGTWKLLNE